MAFVANKDSNNESTGGVNVLGQGGAAPADQSQGGSADSQATQGSSAITSTGGSVNNATSQGNAVSKKAPKASSGMFTNIQKYVQKNQPQAQKMAEVSTRDFKKRADEIRKNTKMMADVKKLAQEQVNVLNTFTKGK